MQPLIITLSLKSMYHALTCIDNKQLAPISDNDKHSDHKTSKKQNKTNNNKIQRLERGGGGVGGRKYTIHTASQNI